MNRDMAEEQSTNSSETEMSEKSTTTEEVPIEQGSFSDTSTAHQQETGEDGTKGKQKGDLKRVSFGRDVDEQRTKCDQLPTIHENGCVKREIKTETTPIKTSSEQRTKCEAKKSLRSCLSKVKSSRIYYIELLILTFNLAQGLRASANFPSFYDKVCLDMYSSTPIVCADLKMNKTAENIVQKETARWLMFNEIITFVPNLLSAMFFGSFGDKYGRKIPTLISISSMVLHNFLYMLLVSMPLFPVYTLTIEAGLIALAGTKTVFVSAQFAEAANQTQDTTKLTQRFSIMTACLSLAIFIAGNISPFLLQYCSLLWLMVIGQIVMTVCFLFALLLHAPIAEKPLSKDSNTSYTIETYGKTISPRKSIISSTASNVKEDGMLLKMLNLYRSAWRTLTKSRPHHGRLHLFVFCFIGLIYSCADSGMDQVTTLYVYHAPLSWTPSIFSRWMATMNMAQMVGGICGTYALKRFRCSDYTVVLIGLLSEVLKMVCMSVATQTWMMYLAVCLGCVSNVGISSLRSLVTQVGTSEEAGELTSMLSIVMGWAQLSGSLICNNLYTATVHLYTGLTFVVVAALLLVCFFIIGAVILDVRRLTRLGRTVRHRKMGTTELPHIDSLVFHVENINI